MKQRGILLALGVFLVFSLAGVSFGQGDIFVKDGLGTVSKQKWAPGEIIVKFKAGVSQDVIRQANQTHGCSVLSVSKRGKFHLLGISKNRTVEEMVSIYEKNPNVEYAEPNFIASALYTPNDPLYPLQWNLHDSSGGITGGINMESAWDRDITPPLYGGDPTVVVAVIDTGVAYLAPDLAATTFRPGYDFVNIDSDPSDDDSHGTHVTGTITQDTNNNKGVAGIAFNTAIMPVKVLDSNGSGTYENIVAGIYFAADNGADVINMSLGGTSASPTLESALAYAHDDKGVTIVCAAGNEFERGNSPLYPAAYDDYCIAVGATRYDELKSYYSNTGPYVDIVAPGGHIEVDPDTGEPVVDQNGDGQPDGILQQTINPITKDTNDFGYWFFHGTSMATPHVAGVAALLIANGICQENLRLAIESTAKDLGAPGRDDEYGWGLVDAYAALNYIPPDVHDVAVTDISVPSPALDGDILVDVNVANWGTFEESFMVTLYVDGDQVGDSPLVSSLAACAKANLTFDWSGATIGVHTLRAVADLTSDEIDTNNSIETTVMVQDSNAQEGPDVEVVSLDAPLVVTKGVDDIVNVTAVIANSLDLFSPTAETAYITVSLYDVTDGRQIDESLGPNYPLEPFWQGLTMLGVEFPWDITDGSTSTGTHELRVDVITASVDPVPENNSMTAYTDVLSGTTTSPTVTTGAATSIATNSVTLNGTVNPNGDSTVCNFEYGTTTGYGITTTSTSAGSGTSNVSISADISGLNANTTYHYRLVATNNNGTTYGSDMIFATLASCTYNISPASQTFDSSGGTDSVSVTTAGGCDWTATSNDTWITITSGSSGTGNGTVGYTVSANGVTARTGTVTVAGNTFTVTQAAAPCVYTISPASQTFDSSGGTGSVSVTTAGGCDWTATSNDTWITITSGSSGTGNGTVGYTVSANTGAARTGTVTVAGNTFTVTVNGVNQAPVAGFSVTPTGGEAPLTVQFIDNSTGVITNWNWKVERWHEKRGKWVNVTDLTGEFPPSVVLEKAGLHMTTLTVTGPGGSDIMQVGIDVTKPTKGGGNGRGKKNK